MAAISGALNAVINMNRHRRRRPFFTILVRTLEIPLEATPKKDNPSNTHTHTHTREREKISQKLGNKGLEKRKSKSAARETKCRPVGSAPPDGQLVGLMVGFVLSLSTRAERLRKMLRKKRGSSSRKIAPSPASLVIRKL